VLAGQPQTAAFALVDEAGLEIASVALGENPDLTGGFRGDIQLPIQNFRLQAKGLDVAGIAYKVLSGAFAPVPFAVKFEGRGAHASPGESVEIPFSLVNFSDEADFQVAYVSPLIARPADVFHLAKNELKQASITVQVPTEAVTSTKYSIAARITLLGNSSVANDAMFEVRVAD
jgi:hypothetical protein